MEYERRPQTEFMRVYEPPPARSCSTTVWWTSIWKPLGWDEGTKNQAKLFIFDKDKKLHVIKLEELTISNGIDWSLDNRVFYHTDSGERTIFRYDFDPQTLELSNKNVFYIPEVGTPDGLTIDSQDNLWFAIWDGWKVVQLSPDGELMSEIELPVQRPTSVILGGQDLKTLFITSASVDLPEATLYGEQPMAGDLFAVQVTIPGKKANRML